jgi:hypothetical protein
MTGGAAAARPTGRPGPGGGPPRRGGAPGRGGGAGPRDRTTTLSALLDRGGVRLVAAEN